MKIMGVDYGDAAAHHDGIGDEHDDVPLFHQTVHGRGANEHKAELSSLG